MYGVEGSMTIREKVARAIYESNCERIGIKADWNSLGLTGTSISGSYDNATAAITAFLEAAAAEGWHMQPDEATEEMVYQAEGISDFVLPKGLDTSREGRWAEMKMALGVANEAAPEFEWDK
jgi:hypothetical protein